MNLAESAFKLNAMSRNFLAASTGGDHAGETDRLGSTERACSLPPDKTMA